ncbi:HPr-rel-A system PqqD family peptide chaperone [Sphingomonas sp.]|uniref:HPr-rel-A system PqqD family peptide chaperone n=1 Tax=Sphingomonas sp. TaxID=28214 RepID=UPI002C2933CC|nr:HPr-rel-A system PqqD family peptide chaperone [Sphingomonas sp.]HTG38002.1 HPr-rel-A system PqqD family peptide chaperone [Sphingomonas sp.]
MRYRAADPALLRVVPLDWLTAIYHRPSGQTHLVESPVPELLAALGGDTLSVEALLSRLVERYDLLDPHPISLAARLDELASVGLVEIA